MLFLTKKSVLINAFLLSTVVCFAQSKTILSGRIEGLDIGSKITIGNTARNGRFDSLTVTSDSFKFILNVEKGDIYFLGYTSHSQPFGEFVFLQQGANIHINRNGESVSYSSSKLAKEQNNFMHGVMPFFKEESLLDKKLQQTKDSSLLKNININKGLIAKRRENYYINWVKAHTNSPVSVEIIYMYMQGMSGHITKPLYDQLSPQAKDNNAVTEIMPYYFAQRQVDDQFKVGKQIKDFVLPDTAGSPHTFLSLKGNDYVLLDIWASWCGPCRKSTPELRRLLHKYQQMNFKVISISADTDSKLWKEAIVKDTMDWCHLSDLQGTDAGFMKDSYIFEYPTYILVSPDGTIISKPNNINRVGEYLAQIFAEPGESKS